MTAYSDLFLIFASQPGLFPDSGPITQNTGNQSNNVPDLPFPLELQVMSSEEYVAYVGISDNHGGTIVSVASDGGSIRKLSRSNPATKGNDPAAFGF